MQGLHVNTSGLLSGNWAPSLQTNKLCRCSEKNPGHGIDQTPQTEAFRAVLLLLLATGTDLLNSQLNLPSLMSDLKGFLSFYVLFNSSVVAGVLLDSALLDCLFQWRMWAKVSHSGCNLSISFYCRSALLIMVFFRHSFVLLWSKTLYQQRTR